MGTVVDALCPSPLADSTEGSMDRFEYQYDRSVLLGNLSVASPTSQLILQPYRRFTYVTAHSPIVPLLHLRHSSLSNPSFASPTSRALHLCHLASRPAFNTSTVQDNVEVYDPKKDIQCVLYSERQDIFNYF